MAYDLWDVELGKQFGSFRTETEALRLVRLMIDAYGEEYAADLDQAGPGLEPNLTGAALVERARSVEPSPAPAKR